jgi:hypothetical protein
MKKPASSAKVCGSVCIDDAGCPSDFRCASVAQSGTLSTKACVTR